MPELDWEQARFNMIEQQIRPWDVLDPRVLDVLAETPRELFAPEAHKRLAFADLEVPLDHDQFMLAPKVEGRLLQALDVQPDDSVLEIGAGSGFLSACLAQLGSHVTSVDIFDDLADMAASNLQQAGLRNAIVECGDASQGWNSNKQYDVIAVTGSLPEYHHGFEQLLAPGGRLFIVTGERPVMHAMLITSTGDSRFSRTTLFETDLKPLVNAGKKPAFDF